MTEELRRASDPGNKWLLVVHGFTKLWDFIDNRDIDKHLTAIVLLAFIIIGTFHITGWAMDSYSYWTALLQAGRAVPGSDVALVIAAVVAPWSLIVSTVTPFLLSFYFKSRA